MNQDGREGRKSRKSQESRKRLRAGFEKEKKWGLFRTGSKRLQKMMRRMRRRKVTQDVMQMIVIYMQHLN
jgi:replicative DNA helicase